MTKHSIYIIACIAAVLTGCDKGVSESTRGASSAKGRYIRDFSTDDVIVEVNGVGITKRNYDCLQNLLEKLYRLQRGIELTGRNAQAERYTFSSEQHLPEILLRDELMEQVAESAGVRPSEADVRKQWEDCSRGLRRAGKSLDEVQAEIGGDEGALLGKLLYRKAQLEEYLEKVVTNGWNVVSDQEVTNRMLWVKQFNDNADRCNEAASNMLVDVRSKILSGSFKFSAAAEKYSEVKPEEGRKWESFQLGELPDGQDGEKNRLREWLEGAKPGDISYPLEMDDGIAIIGLVSKWDDEVPGAQGPVANYDLVRITRYFREYSPYQNPGETRQQLLKWKREDALKELGAKVYAAAEITYPNGTNFYPDVEESYKWWQEEFKRR